MRQYLCSPACSAVRCEPTSYNRILEEPSGFLNRQTDRLDNGHPLYVQPSVLLWRALIDRLQLCSPLSARFLRNLSAQIISLSSVGDRLDQVHRPHTTGSNIFVASFHHCSEAHDTRDIICSSPSPDVALAMKHASRNA